MTKLFNYMWAAIGFRFFGTGRLIQSPTFDSSGIGRTVTRAIIPMSNVLLTERGGVRFAPAHL